VAYADELVNNQYKGNVVVRINGGAYYARHQPDSGLVIPAAQLVLGKFSINPQIISIEDAKTTFSSATFSLVDKDGLITALFTNNLNVFMGQEVEIWMGRITGSLAFSGYLKLQKFNISRVTFKGEEFEFTAQEITANFKKAVYNTQAPLGTASLVGAATLVASSDISGFPASGRLFIDNEFKDYTSKVDSTKTFTLSGVTVAAHSRGAVVYNVKQVSAQNPIDILLRVLQSAGAGTYASYTEGLAVADADLDLTGIIAIRDAKFSGEAFTFELFGIEDVLEFLENEILLPCSLRFIATADNKLGLTVLDTSIFGASTKELDSGNIDPKSVSYEVNAEGIRNRVEIHYAYDYATDTYADIYSLEDAESIANYGRQDPFIVRCKGVPTGAGGLAIATDRADRWLARLSNATPQISVSTFFENSLVLIGERVLLTYSLPTEIGTRLFSKELEVIRKGLDETKGMVKLDLAFTNYSGLREAYVSPTETVAAWVAGTKTLTVTGNVTGRWVGTEVIRLRDSAGITADAVRTILSAALVGADTAFVLDAVFDATASGSVAGKAFQFANYDEGITTKQKSYSFFSTASSDFVVDGTRPYQVTF